MNYYNPSIDDLEQFRRTLLNQLLFEPATDPGFVRRAEKHHFLVRQNGEMISKLRKTIAGQPLLGLKHCAGNWRKSKAMSSM